MAIHLRATFLRKEQGPHRHMDYIVFGDERVYPSAGEQG